MTDNDFSKAFNQCLSNESCIGCPLDHNDYASDCVTEIFKYCSEAIKRKHEQIESLIAGQETLQKALAEKTEEVEKITEVYSNLIIEKDELFEESERLIKQAISEAVKEFAERLKDEVTYYEDDCGNFVPFVNCRNIDKAYEEMVGDTK